MNQLLKRLFIPMVIFLTLCGAAVAYSEYAAVKKYYPEISFTDYLFIGDKLRITPEMR